MPNYNAGDKDEEKVEGDSEGSSLGIWELLLTINRRREREVSAWVCCVAEARKLLGSTRRAKLSMWVRSKG